MIDFLPRYTALSSTVEPCFTDIRSIRTPQYCLSQRKAQIISLKLTRLLWTPVNMDNGHFSVSCVANSFTLSTPLYGHCLSVHSPKPVIVTITFTEET